MRTEGDRVRDVNDSPFSAVRSAPRDGDVLVTREAHSAVTYSVRQVPGVVQFHAAFRDEALRLARSFARTMAVDSLVQRGRHVPAAGSVRAAAAVSAMAPTARRPDDLHHVALDLLREQVRLMKARVA